MGQPTKGHDLLDPGRERQGRELWHDSQPPGDLAPIEGGNGVAVEPGLPGARWEGAGDDPQERGLARAVRPYEGQPLAGSDDEVDAGHDLAIAVGDADALELDRGPLRGTVLGCGPAGRDGDHSSYPVLARRSRTRKNGAPMTAVTTPTGISPRIRATRSA